METDSARKRAILTGLLLAYGSERFTHTEYKQIADVVSEVDYLTLFCVRGVISQVHGRDIRGFVYFLSPGTIEYMKEWSDVGD